MKLWRFEGTAEEFSAVASSLMGAEVSPMAVAPEADMVETLSLDDQDIRFVTEDEARHILTRLELSENMKNMLRVLYKAKGRMLSEDIRDEIGLNSDQFRGMTGAFGRRTAYSVPGHVRFFDAQWEGESGQFSWLLPDAVKVVLKEVGF